MDLHLLLWYSEDVIRAQLGLLAIIARVGGARVLEVCVAAVDRLDGGAAGGIRAPRLVKMACHTVLEQLVVGLESNREEGRSDLDAWVVSARQVYTQTSALLNSCDDDRDEEQDDNDDDEDNEDDDNGAGRARFVRYRSSSCTLMLSCSAILVITRLIMPFSPHPSQFA